MDCIKGVNRAVVDQEKAAEKAADEQVSLAFRLANDTR